MTAALADRGKNVWVDWADIPPTAQWMAEISAAIDAADTYVVLLSPDSIASKVCAAELDVALRANKRIVPLLIRDMDETKVPDEVAELNWVLFTDGFEPAVAKLVEALDTDLEHVRAHTRLLVRAREWEKASEDRSLLLRGRALKDAEAVLESNTEPAATQDQTRFVAAARRAAMRRQRGAISGISAMLLVAVILGVLAWDQRGNAIEQRELAEQRAAESRSRELAAVSQGQLPIDPQLSLLLAIEGAESAETVQARGALTEAMHASFLRASFVGPHEDGLLFAQASADGTRLLTVDYERAGLWDAQTSELMRTFNVYQGGATFSMDGSRVIALGEDQRASVFEAASGDPLRESTSRAVWWARPPPGDPARFDPTGTRALVFAKDGLDRVLVDTVSGKQVGSLGFSLAAVFSSDGKYVVTVDQNPSETKIWRAEDGELVERFPLEGFPGSVAFSLDGKTILADGSDGGWRSDEDEMFPVVQVDFEPIPGSGATLLNRSAKRVTFLAAATGEEIARIGGLRDADDAAVSPDGSIIATASGEHTVQVWSVPSRTLLATLVGHTDQVMDVEFLPDERLLTASSDGSARIWDVSGVTTVATPVVAHAERLDFSTVTTEGPGLLVPRGDVVDIMNPASAEVAAVLKGHTGAVLDAAITPDGSTAVTSSKDGTAIVWNALSGERLRTLAGDGTPIASVAIDHSARFVVTTDTTGASQVWDVRRGVRLADLDPAPHKNPPRFLPDGSALLVWAPDDHGEWWSEIVSSLRLVDPRTGSIDTNLGSVLEAAPAFLSPDSTAVVAEISVAKHRTRQGHIALVPLSGRPPVRLADAVSTNEFHNIDAFGFGPDGSLVAGRPFDWNATEADPSFAETVSVWRVPEGDQLLNLHGHGDYATATAFSPDGRTLATTGSDQTVRLWRVPAGEQLDALRDFDSTVVDVAFGADGTRVVTAEDDGTVVVWDVEAGAPLMSVDVPRVSSASFLGDRAFLAIDQAGISYVFRCETCGSFEELLEQARDQTTRGLTPREREAYLS